MTQQLENVQEQPRNRDGELREMTQQLTNVRRQLQERDGQLSEKDRQLRERDEQLREMTQQLTDARRQLQERDGQLRNRDGELRQMTQQLTDTRSQRQERDGQLRNRDGELRQMTQQLTDIRSQLQERDGQLRNRDGELRQMTQQLTDIRSQLQERDGQLQEKTQQLTNVEGQLEERGGQLRERTRQFTNIESQLEDRDRELRETRQQLKNAEEQLQGKDEELSFLASRLEEKEQEVDELEESLSATRNPDWIIPRDQIQLTEKFLGRGEWGSVVEGKYCGFSVAVIQMYESILSDYIRGLFEREMDIASRCRHPCLLQFIGASNEGRSPLFVTELLESSLRALLNQRSLSTIEISVISLDVARALNYLHLKKPSPIIHRDISSANVLLWRQGDQWRGKVSHYGTANFMQQTMTACTGAYIYSAPEAFPRTVKVQCIPDIFKLQLYLFHR